MISETEILELLPYLPGAKELRVELEWNIGGKIWIGYGSDMADT